MKDFQRAKEFYEKRFEVEINEKIYKVRWASPIPELSIINPEFHVKERVPYVDGDMTYDNNVILTLLTDELEKEKDRVTYLFNLFIPKCFHDIIIFIFYSTR